ncbi:hypothetical protein DCCM_4171 [Desulfocucumis palustris]|uniref:Uncharacterized protein n=1 Tax=Desulfocucumis palustris TaxID=1898651 RepID=A0A2L2XFX1_9FIRM|nr:DsrE family protein [Desulfocucumis palustris]GBF35050.1 hypothetical protein DCCM_4171 [Desulfocucumis palustris]
MNRLKVLFHVNEPERWKIVLVNARNFINDVGQGRADVEIVANGAGVTAYAGDAAIIEEMKVLHSQGVVFAACRNALKMHALEESSLPGFVLAVSAGITEIAQKQSEGYSYIKP